MIYSVQMTLEQRSTTPDESEIHCEKWVLETWDKTPSDDKATWLWRGPQHPALPGETKGQPNKLIDSVVDPPRETNDSVHLNAGPRLPSICAGGLTATGVYPNSAVSSTDHTFNFEVLYSVYGMDENDNPIGDTEGVKRQARYTVKASLGDCSLAKDTVQVPRYTSIAPKTTVDLQGCMEEYTAGTEPRCFGYPRESWIVHSGKVISRKRQKPVTAKEVRRHQMDTSAMCMCFFEEVIEVPPPGGNASDYIPNFHMNETSQDGVESQIEKIREIHIDEWKHNHPQARKHIPGFLHIIFASPDRNCKDQKCICSTDSLDGFGVSIPASSRVAKERNLVTITREFGAEA